jgi:S-adenosylmethionine decarboxylase
MSAEYEFYGRHLTIEMADCRVDLNDAGLIRRDLTLAIERVGATILQISDYQFHPVGLTMLFMLSESHASIHTYPEHNACFLDIFTCGRAIDLAPFADILCALWQPKSFNKNLLERSYPDIFIPIITKHKSHEPLPEIASVG